MKKFIIPISAFLLLIAFYGYSHRTKGANSFATIVPAILGDTTDVSLQRGFSFNNVNTLSFTELNSWLTGKFLPPTDGILVRGVKGPTVY